MHRRHCQRLRHYDLVPNDSRYRCRGLGFDSRAGQIGTVFRAGQIGTIVLTIGAGTSGLISGLVKSVATLAVFFRSSLAQTLSRGDGPHHSLHASV